MVDNASLSFCYRDQNLRSSVHNDGKLLLCNRASEKKHIYTINHNIHLNGVIVVNTSS